MAVNLAFTAGYQDPAFRYEWIREHAYAVEYAPDPERLDLLPQTVLPLVRQGIPTRLHTRYFDYELGHADRIEADKALKVHLRTLEKMQGLSEPVVTVHTGLVPALPFREEHFRKNLSRLVQYANRMGVTVCLENLRLGHGSDPFKILQWAEESGAMITLDLGHALGCPRVLNQEMSILQVVELFASRVFGVHIYGKEDEQGHHGVEDIEFFKPLMHRLLQTHCRWWTVELSDPGLAMSTRSKVENYLERFYPVPDWAEESYRSQEQSRRGYERK